MAEEKDTKKAKAQHIQDALAARQAAVKDFDQTRRDPNTDEARIAENTFADPRREAIITAFDADGDGRISRDEFQKKLDPNKDGRISKKEIDAFDKGLPRDAQDDFHNLLRLKDGVSTKTVESWLGTSLDSRAPDTIEAALRARQDAIPDFDKTRRNPNTDDARIAENKFADARRDINRLIFDKNKDGRISRDELESRLDPDKDGTLSKQEIEAFNKTLPESARKDVQDMLRIKEGGSLKTVESWLGMSVATTDPVAEKSPANTSKPSATTPAKGK